MWLSILLVFIAFSDLTTEETRKQGTLVVNITNIRENKGAVHIALYDDPATFLHKEGVCSGAVMPPAAAESLQWVAEGRAYGAYTLAVFHDINNNGRLDKNVLGIPTEPYAFAVKEPSKWQSPTFEEVAFIMDAPEKKISLSLAYWKER